MIRGLQREVDMAWTDVSGTNELGLSFDIGWSFLWSSETPYFEMQLCVRPCEEMELK